MTLPKAFLFTISLALLVPVHADEIPVIELTKSYFAGKPRALARKVFHDNAIAFYDNCRP